ncbi:MAG: hypothetical protein ACK4NS_10745 [Saprospiraceae bacterium]
MTSSLFQSAAENMPPWRARPIWRLAIAGAALALLSALLICSRAKLSALSAVPEQMPLAYCLPGSDVEMGARPLRAPIFGLPTAWDAALERDLKDLQSLLAPDTLLAPPLERVVAFTLSPGDSMRALMIWAYPRARDLARFFDKKEPELQTSALQFRGRKIYRIRLGGGDILSVSQYGNLLVASKKGYLVEDALNQLASGKNRVWGKERGVGAPALLIAPRNLALALSPLLKPEYRTLFEPWSQSDAPVWTLRGRKDQVLLTPMRARSAQRSSADPAQLNIALGYIPDNVVWFERKSLDASAVGRKWLSDWAASPVAYVLTGPLSEGMLRDAFYTCVGVRDNAKLRQTLLNYGARYGFKRKPDDYMSFPIYEYAGRNDLLGGLTVNLPGWACADLGRMAVFAGSRKALEIWIDKYLSGQLLINAPDFAAALKDGETDGGYLAAFRVAAAPRIAECFFISQKCPVSYPPLLAAAAADSWWIAASNPARPDSFSVRKAKKINGLRQAVGSASLRWRVELNAQVIRGPYLTQSENGRNLFLQDADHVAYCYDLDGNIIFRKQLDGPLLSPVISIDIYGSGAPVFAANTAAQIWMFDGSGADTRGFPLRLQSKAVNGICAAALSGVGQTCLYVACDNGNAYGFDLYGRPMAGWNPMPRAGYSPWPLVHLSYGGKDYLILLDIEGRQIRALGPDGAERFSPVPLVGVPAGPLQVDPRAAPPRMAVPLQDGRFVVANLAGESFILNVGKGPGPHRGVLAPLLGHTRLAYVCSGLESLRGMGYRGNRLETLFEAHPNGCDTLFALDYPGFGGWDSRRRKIMLFNDKGRRVFDAPLAGSGPFVLAHDPAADGYFLFTPLNDQLMAYFMPR